MINLSNGKEYFIKHEVNVGKISWSKNGEYLAVWSPSKLNNFT